MHWTTHLFRHFRLFQTFSQTLSHPCSRNMKWQTWSVWCLAALAKQCLHGLGLGLLSLLSLLFKLVECERLILGPWGSPLPRGRGLLAPLWRMLGEWEVHVGGLIWGCLVWRGYYRWGLASLHFTLIEPVCVCVYEYMNIHELWKQWTNTIGPTYSNKSCPQLAVNSKHPPLMITEV